jgi:anti-sigma factor ChrR (cupin superfamily)
MSMATDLEELAALDAAGALDEAEQRQYRERLKTASAAERTAIAQFYDLAAAVASEPATVAPPAGSLERLMQRIEASQVYRSGMPHVYSVLAHEGDWRPGPVAGTRVKILSLDRARDSATLLMRVEPGARYPAHGHTSAEDCYVIAGEIVIQGQRLHAGDFHRAEAGSDHAELSSEKGAEVLLVVGASDYHL